MSILQGLGRRFARFTTNQVVRQPRSWRFLRGLTRLQFDRLAPVWDSMRSPESLAPFETALEAVETPPRRALDVGTGTGVGAFTVARRFPDAEVVGVDLSGSMLAEARRKTPPELAGRIRFEEGDAQRLPYPDDSFELVTLANMIPFFDELARVLATGGSALFSFSVGPQTPIYVPPSRRGSTGPDVLFWRRFSGRLFPEDCQRAQGACVATHLAPGAGSAWFVLVSRGGEGRNRTGDTTVFSRVLYRLSYLAANPQFSDEQSRSWGLRVRIAVGRSRALPGGRPTSASSCEV